MMVMIIGEFSIRADDLRKDFDNSLAEIRIRAPLFVPHEDDLEIND
jgi:hypothetical protein